jgi:predicted nucleic acid-binding protein
MNEGGRPVVLLDANVLYPAPLRDLLLYLAAAKLYRPLWSGDIQEEWIRNLLVNRPDLSETQLRKTASAMDRAFPDARVKNYKSYIGKLYLPDPEDRHVLAAAIKGRASIIATINLKDFPSQKLKIYEMEAQHPDVFIASLLKVNTQEVLAAFTAQVENMKKPPLSVNQVLANLEANGLVRTVSKLRELLGR